MKPEELSPFIAPSGKFTRTHEPTPKVVEVVEDQKKPNGQTDRVKTPQLDHVQFNKLEAINSDTSDIAKDIRKVSQSLESIDSYLKKMQTALESIVKIYPPYPPGSSERVEALRQFSAFRKLIDQIAHPRRSSGLENILGDPGKNPRSGDLSLRTGQGKADLVIRHQPAHTGPGGLDLPEMAMDSSDRQINTAIEKTSSAQQALNSKRLNFVSDANRVIASIA